MNYAPFRLTEEQQKTKDILYKEEQDTNESRIDDFIKKNGLVNKRRSPFLDLSFYYDDPKTGDRYRISVLNNYIVVDNTTEELDSYTVTQQK